MSFIWISLDFGPMFFLSPVVVLNSFHVIRVYGMSRLGHVKSLYTRQMI